MLPQDEGEGKILRVAPMSGDLAFGDDVTEECKRIYAHIVGTTDGFLEMSEEMRRMHEMQEDE